MNSREFKKYKKMVQKGSDIIIIKTNLVKCCLKR